MSYLNDDVKAASTPPRDYKLVTVDLGHGMSFKQMVCKKCGCPVTLVRVHNDWHKANG